MKDANASSNQNLFVSAESSQYNNYFAGPQVIQVVVSDPDIQRLDQAYSEPTVTINGKKIRMAQATDGNWYAYFADSKQAQIADSTASMAKKGLNFGEFCSASSAIAATGVDFADTIGIAIASNAPGSSNGIQNPSTNVTVTCTGSATA
ncbi:MAG: peptidase, partial [Thaumarchaeota archaeon]